jgi:tRNA A-37 threonylcarbamoyl transferase component Bud32
MNFSQLNTYTFIELQNIASKMGLSKNKSKRSTLESIISGFEEYEEYKNDKIDKYTRIKQLGKGGKEGVTYLVRTVDEDEYAMKTFKQAKSSKNLKKEAALQQQASKSGITPIVIDIDTVSKYIVMERMDKHLFDVMKKQNGTLNKIQQQSIIKIFKKLDSVGVFHGDSNILNYMYKGRKLYIIDFGMSKEIDKTLIKKLGTKSPNLDIMTLGLILKLKELGCPSSSYKYLLQYISENEKERFQL